MDLNLSIGKKYYSQLDNKDRPYHSCNVTAIVNMLTVAGVNLEYPANMQPEDYLAHLVDQPDSVAVRDKMGPDFKKYPPRQVFACLIYATNKWIGKKVVGFEALTVKEIAYHIMGKMKPIVLSTILGGLSGHMVTVIGIVSDQLPVASVNGIELDKINGFYIDDPYGNFHTKYTNKNGNDVFISYADFYSLTKKVGEFERKNCIVMV